MSGAGPLLVQAGPMAAPIAMVFGHFLALCFAIVGLVVAVLLWLLIHELSMRRRFGRTFRADERDEDDLER